MVVIIVYVLQTPIIILLLEIVLRALGVVIRVPTVLILGVQVVVQVGGGIQLHKIALPVLGLYYMELVVVVEVLVMETGHVYVLILTEDQLVRLL